MGNSASEDFNHLFRKEILETVIPDHLADDFFEALFGDPAEGAYDIGLTFQEQTAEGLVFNFQLRRRPEKCLRCSLTYGLPRVFARHPVINLSGIVQKINALLDGRGTCGEFRLGRTREVSEDLHEIPLVIQLTD